MQRLGFIHDMMDVKVLILLVTARSNYPMSIQEIYEVCYVDDCLSYFDVCTAVPEMVKSGHLLAVEDDKFEITPKGKVILESSEIANGPGHHGYINIPGTDEWRIVYHRRIIGDLEAGHRVLCIDQLHFDGDEIVPVTMT